MPARLKLSKESATDFIPRLENLRTKAVVSLRPRRFGKTLFADTLAQYYDELNASKFDELFGHLDIGKRPTPLANSFLVLPLNFSGLKTDTAKEFKMSLNDRLNTLAGSYKARYNLQYQINPQNALDTYTSLFEEMHLKQKKVYVIIDEYDASINQALGDRSFVSALRSSPEDYKNPLKQMENMYSKFFSELKTACDKGVARCFITGVTPLVLSEFASGFNNAQHITDDLDFALMYGFTESDVRKGLAKLKLEEAEVLEILKTWKAEHDGYYFHPRAWEPLYNPTRILHGLQQLERMIQRGMKPTGLNPKESAMRIQEEMLFDPNSRPAESTLLAIREARYAPIIVRKMLAQEGAKINTPGRAQEVFRLSHMNELATSPKPLLSFMRYMGALTYVPVKPEDRITYALKIPNQVAFREFLQELHARLNLDETGRTDLSQAVDTLVEKKQLGPFCKAVSQHLLSRGNARDVKLGEDPFAQAVFDAMVLMRRNADRVFKEFAFTEVSKSQQRYVDIVYCVHKSPQQRDNSKPPDDHYHYLSLKSIPVPGLKLSGGVTDWNKLCSLSRDMIDKKSPDEIVNLLLAHDYCVRHHLPPESTVQSVVDKAIKEVQDNYIPALGCEHATFWVLVRVGLQTILLYEVINNNAKLVMA
ncbi:hypothetical protein QOT17_003077 [Balamuthia mandrillaris]